MSPRRWVKIIFCLLWTIKYFVFWNWLVIITCQQKRQQVWSCWRTWWGWWRSGPLCTWRSQTPSPLGSRWWLGKERRKWWRRSRPRSDWVWTGWLCCIRPVHSSAAQRAPGCCRLCPAGRWGRRQLIQLHWWGSAGSFQIHLPSLLACWNSQSQTYCKSEMWEQRRYGICVKRITVTILELLTVVSYNIARNFHISVSQTSVTYSF